MSEVILSLVQMSVGRALTDNVEKAESLIRQAASGGANIVLLPELFESRYFCQLEREAFFAQAHPAERHPFLGRFQKLAAELQLVLPVSFFERAGQAHFNSLAVIDADGAILGIYRKSHIPDGPGYEEKFYFNPGNTGFPAWPTRYGTIGCGICWDQWFPECARVLVLRGADLLLYPSAIGSEPADQVLTPNTSAMWQRAMIGHAVCNACYIGAANRVGQEEQESSSCHFYGHSFICNYQGEVLSELGPEEEGLVLAALDLEAARIFRAGMGFFRDRRPEFYAPLVSLDGNA